MVERVPSRNTTLNNSSLGPPILSDASVQRILDKMDLPFADGIQIAKITDALNFVITRYLQTRLEHDYRHEDRDKLMKMEAFLKDYSEKSQEYSDAKYPPPMFPKDWYLDAVKWFDDLRDQFKDRSTGGPIRKDKVEHLLMPLSAIFNVVFDLKPTSSAPGGKPTTGACSRFIAAVIREVRHALIRPETSDYNVGEDSVYVLDIGEMSDDALSAGLKKVLRLKPNSARPPDDNTGGSSGFEAQSNMQSASLRWETEASFLRSLYLKSSKQQQ